MSEVEPALENNEIDFSKSDGFDGSPNIPADSFVDPAEFEGTGENKDRNTTTIRINGIDYPIIIEERVKFLAEHAYTHNELNQLTTVTLTGKSGTGKSAFTGTFAHDFHTLAEKHGIYYQIKWFKQEDIQRLDEIIQATEKGINQIWIFEDVSFQEIEDDIKEKFTYVRHIIKARLLLILQIHYSKAIDPFMRDGDIQIFTSITKVEKENMLMLLGRNDKASRYFINRFEYKYHSMNFEGYFITNPNGNRIIKNYTKRPFKIALVNDGGRLHFTCYHEASCERCKKRKTELPDEKTLYLSLSHRDFLTTTAKSYRPTKVKVALRHRLYFAEGIDVLDRRSKYLMHRLTAYYHEHPEHWKELCDLVKTKGSVDAVLRTLGVVTGDPSREEERGSRLVDAKNKRKLRQRLKKGSKSPTAEATTTAIPPTLEGLAAAGVQSMDAGPMNDEDLIGRDEGNADDNDAADDEEEVETEE